MSKYDAFLVSSEVHERTVELADGSKHVLHFRELPVSVYRKFQIAEGSADDDVRAGSMARLISASLCEPDGNQSMSYDQALKLKPGPCNALFKVILSLNGVGDKGKDLPSAETSGSGTSSPSPSAKQ